MSNSPAESGPRKKRPRRKKSKTSQPDAVRQAKVDPFEEMGISVRGDGAGFEHFGLHETLVENCRRMGYSQPTEIQTTAIPAVMEKRDLIAIAQTGTGKTAAFLLPVLNQMVSEEGNGAVRGLVLSPTRELAMQTQRHFRCLAHGTGLRSTLLLGGASFKPQADDLRNGVDMVIATPGRLLDHMQRGTCKLNKARFLIMDEGDRMLDMGFIPDVRRIISYLPRERQTLLFSATMPSAVMRFCEEASRDAQTIRTTEGTTIAEGIRHYLYRVPQWEKLNLLLDLLKDDALTSVMVFKRTKRGTEMLTHKLKRKGISVTSIHGDLKQNQRIRALQEFKDKKYRVLIATDVASRGLDINDVSHVINYDVPGQAEDYVHRVGRTGRHKSEGDAYTFASLDEETEIRSIERMLKYQIPSRRHPEFCYPNEPKSAQAEKEESRPRAGRGLKPSRKRKRRR